MLEPDRSVRALVDGFVAVLVVAVVTGPLIACGTARDDTTSALADTTATTTADTTAGTTVAPDATTTTGSISNSKNNGKASTRDEPVADPVDIDPAELLDGLRSLVRDDGVIGGPIETPDGWYALTADHRDGAPDLWRFAERGWKRVNARLRADLLLVDRIETFDLDGDGTDEVLVTTVLNGFAGSLLRYESGEWTEIAWSEELAYSEEDGLTGVWNDCEPSCAEGTMYRFRIVWQDGELAYLDLD